MGRLCTVAGCDRTHVARGYCAMHWRRWKDHGSTDDPRPSPQQRFWAKVDKTDDCWIWTGAKTSAGYGNFNQAPNANRAAHRVAYEWLRGPIPDGLDLDHLCRNRACVNPDHLEPVTRRENTMRGASPSVLAHRAGRCMKDLHDLTPENQYRAPKGRGIRCRECMQECNRRSNAKRRRAA